MVRGLYTSAIGMHASMQRMDVITNNIANINTNAYRRDHVVSHAFTERFLHRLHDPDFRTLGLLNPVIVGRVSPGLFVDEIFTDWSQGSMQRTDGPLDLAIMGQGFFVVMAGDEELFTRDGAFTLAHGALLTSCGGRVQGLNGDIVLPNGEIAIGDDGRIFVNGEYADTLRLASFTDPNSLRKLENNFFRATAESVPAAFGGSVQQGFLEGSNFNIVSEMVQMINLTRAYETNARMVTMQDQTLQQAVNDIARR